MSHFVLLTNLIFVVTSIQLLKFVIFLIALFAITILSVAAAFFLALGLVDLRRYCYHICGWIHCAPFDSGKVSLQN